MGRLLCGESKSFDVSDLKKNHVSYGFDHYPQHIEEVWKVLWSFSNEEKDSFLQFVTGSPKPPFLGFEHMAPKFAIHAVHINEDQENTYPSASTFSNLLRMPIYKDKSKIGKLLREAI